MQEDDVDPLDAFMDAAVNPEVAAAETAEAARREELRKEQAKALAVSNGCLPISHYATREASAGKHVTVN